MKSIFGTLIVGMALLIGGCYTMTPQEAQIARQLSSDCRARGHLPDVNQFDGRWQRCIPVNMEVSEAKKLECIRAGGMPYTDIVRASGKEYRIYKTCGAKQAVVQQRPVSQPTWTPLPYPNIDTFQKPTTCTTKCNSSGTCTTRC